MKDLHPAWKVCIGLAIVIFVTTASTGKILITQQQGIKDNEKLLEEIQAQQLRGEERSYINRAIAGCADIINDGEMEITDECLDPRVVAYYPPSICSKLITLAVDNCGENALVIIDLEDP